uniref:Uncharacterized protein n=1 Tax=Oryza glaberrima TaxID=4538 RepID=I1NSV4_ORYGL
VNEDLKHQGTSNQKRHGGEGERHAGDAELKESSVDLGHVNRVRQTAEARENCHQEHEHGGLEVHAVVVGPEERRVQPGHEREPGGGDNPEDKFDPWPAPDSSPGLPPRAELCRVVQNQRDGLRPDGEHDEAVQELDGDNHRHQRQRGEQDVPEAADDSDQSLPLFFGEKSQRMAQTAMTVRQTVEAM